MIYTDRKIKEIYNIEFDLNHVPKKDRCPMHDWYNNLINKTYRQIDLFDVTRMIIQKTFLELAVCKSISFIRDNPFCGQRYEGELLELLCGLEVSWLKDYKTEIENILEEALVKNQTYDWICEEERKEFSNLIDAFFAAIE